MGSSMTMTMTSMGDMPMSTATGTASAAAATSTAMSSMSMGGTCKINMLWNWYTIDACFLSSSWHITSKGMFAASCIGVVFLVISLELLRRISKEYDMSILRQFQQNTASQELANKSRSTPEGCPSQPRVVVFRPSPIQQLIRAVLHAVTFGVAYIIMLLAMYYNGYIIICIIVGAGLGKFLCDWAPQKIPVGTAFEQQGDAAEEGPTMCCG
ncbi:hypothetical protein PV08_05078 [Exophiala spinifera]|uniref:Copper transport protein n=1 Tax=Exophiala spinifera TaxID=91928 RepID=A0A0D2BFV2_9EURO|nr:uncharacterized protein PV08_05078 [Exophiala spinifera]KIW17883.1 hypothetical protein PV08_05078 [Exophiala spinifera]